MYFFRPEDAPPPPPYYSSGVVQSTLNYLPSCYFSPALSFVSTIAKKRVTNCLKLIIFIGVCPTLGS